MSRDLILVAVSLFIWGLGEGTFIEFRPLYLEQLGANPVVIGSILGAAGMVMAFSHIPAGILADRFGRRPIMWAGWVAGLAATSLMALADRLSIFAAAVASSIPNALATSAGVFGVESSRRYSPSSGVTSISIISRK